MQILVRGRRVKNFQLDQKFQTVDKENETVDNES